jgi:hypothetical protein
VANAYEKVERPDEPERAASRTHSILLTRLWPDAPLGSIARLAMFRERAEWHTGHRGAPRRLGRSQPKLFDGAPWQHERRPDLIRAHGAAAEGRDVDEDDLSGAVMAIVDMTFMAELDERWGVIPELIAELSDDDRVLQDIAAGHTQERTHPDVTIQTCWDADRLDLGRVGIAPHPNRAASVQPRHRDFGPPRSAEGPGTVFNLTVRGQRPRTAESSY